MASTSKSSAGQKSKQFAIVLLLLLVFIVIGYALGGGTLMWSVIQNIFVGIIIGVILKLALVLLGRTKFGRKLPGIGG